MIDDSANLQRQVHTGRSNAINHDHRQFDFSATSDRLCSLAETAKLFAFISCPRPMLLTDMAASIIAAKAILE